MLDVKKKLSLHQGCYCWEKPQQRWVKVYQITFSILSYVLSMEEMWIKASSRKWKMETETHDRNVKIIPLWEEKKSELEGTQAALALILQMQKMN